MHAWVATTPLGDSTLALNAHRHFAFRTGQDRRLPDCLFRSSITPPAYAPVNASSASFRTPSHDSDSRWLAVPFLVTLSFTTPCRFIPTLSARLSPPWITSRVLKNDVTSLNSVLRDSKMVVSGVRFVLFLRLLNVFSVQQTHFGPDLHRLNREIP
jgi:hypothetical protein